MESARVLLLYLLCGKIAAGKWTLARHLALRPATPLIREDHWTSNLFADELRTIDDYGRFSARLRAAMGPHIVDILRQGLSVVLDFPANTVSNRTWMRSLITQANVTSSFIYLMSRYDLQAEAARAKSGRPAPAPSNRSGIRSVHELFVPPGPAEGFNAVVHRP